MTRPGWRTPYTDWLLRRYFDDQLTMVTAADVFDWVEATLGRPRGGGRHGGDDRGSARNRRMRKHWLLRTFGDGDTCLCHHCRVVLDYATLTVDRIVPGRDGGRYVHGNIRPSCSGCAHRQGADMTNGSCVSAGQEFMGE